MPFDFEAISVWYSLILEKTLFKIEAHGLAPRITSLKSMSHEILKKNQKRLYRIEPHGLFSKNTSSGIQDTCLCGLHSLILPMEMEYKATTLDSIEPHVEFGTATKPL